MGAGWRVHGWAYPVVWWARRKPRSRVRLWLWERTDAVKWRGTMRHWRKLTADDRPLTTGEENTASHLHPHEPEQPPLLGADGRCFVCALSVSQDEVARLREQLGAREKLLADIEALARAALGVEGPADE